MKTIYFVILLSLSSCASSTYYEDCMENNTYKRYGSVENCISEKKESNQRSAAAWAGVGKAISGDKQQ